MTALSFLRSSKIATVPIEVKRAFLLSKGADAAAVDAAVKATEVCLIPDPSDPRDGRLRRRRGAVAAAPPVAAPAADADAKAQRGRSC